MHVPPRHAAARGFALALALSFATASRGGAQECSWSVDLPGAAHRLISLASDGGHGVLVVSQPVNWVDHGITRATLRLHHVLEQGTLDPALPPDGVQFFEPAVGETHRGVLLMSMVPDAAGGVWVLAMHNDPYAPKLRPYETATFRLHHVSASGAVAPGWVAGGLLIPASFGRPDYAGYVGVEPDGAGGIVAIWIAPAIHPRTYVRAQRFAQDGTPLWAGGNDGIMVSDSLRVRSGLRIAGDGAGGFGAVVSTQLNFTSERDVRAFRVLPDGTRAWSQAGVLVYSPLGQDETPESLVLDDSGDLFVLFRTEPIAPGTPETLAQLLAPDGSMMFDGVLALSLGPLTPGGGTVLNVAEGFFTVHGSDVSGTAMQVLDAAGTPLWGNDVDGLPTPPYARPPLQMNDGGLLWVWPDPGSTWNGVPTVIHALEIGGDGFPAPGWPDTGVVVCGAVYGHVMSGVATPDGESLVVGLGCDEYANILPRIVRLARAALSAPGRPGASALRLLPPSPNPSRGEWTVSFALAAPGAAALELYDLAGRRVAHEPLGSLEAGSHTVRFGSAGALAPGVYQLRLRSGAAAAQRLVIRVR